MAGVNPYVGPDSDEHTFVKHMEGVIPLSALFLLVINDSVPVDSYGALDQVRGKYIHAEIASFLRMVERGERSIKDFAVYYYGNTRLDLEARKAFVQALLNEFPCIVKILEGNHFLFVNNQNVASWVKARLGLGKDGPFFSEETGGEKARCQAEELYRKSLGEPHFVLARGLGLHFDSYYHSHPPIAPLPG